jgi:hypothetical protein
METRYSEDERPLHVAAPQNSAFSVMTEAEYLGKPVEEQRGIWLQDGKLAIVQTDCKLEGVTFDNAGMRTLTGRIDLEIEVQGINPALPCNPYLFLLGP